MPRGFRIETGAIVRNGRAGKGRRWSAFLTVAPDGGIETEGEGAGATPRAALDRAVADLAKQGAFKDEEGA